MLFLFNGVMLNVTMSQDTLKVHPWTNIQLSENDNTLRFAVISDLTGGNRKGVFEKYLDYVNLLQPDFVINVGDLVEGYTDLADEYNRQWAGIDSSLSKLDRRFYFVPGNHDLSNDVERNEWKRKFGQSYYHFVFKNTLFLIVNTEFSDKDRIGDEQIAYFKKAINDNKSVRHTFIIMHNPLWDSNNEFRFKEILSFLKGRKFTVFSGHRHHYYYSKKDGNEYYMFATTGAGNGFNGPEFGEFDHIVWVSMKTDKPGVLILSDKGIYPKDIVNDETYPIVNILRSDSYFSIKPIIHNSNSFIELNAILEIRNPAEIDLKLSGNFPPVNRLIFEPDNLSFSISPKEKKEVIIRVKAQNQGLIEQFEKDPVSLKLDASYNTHSRGVISLPFERKIFADYPHSCLRNNKKIKIDGDLSDWTTPFYEVKLPVYIDQGWDWSGSDDGWYKFSVSHDDKYLYIASETYDDKLLLETGRMRNSQDKLIIDITSGDLINTNDLIHIETAPDAVGNGTLIKSNNKEQIKNVCRKTISGFTCECSIPLSLLKNKNEQPNKFVFNIAFMDQDRIENIDPSVLWWRPKLNPRSYIKGAGVFELTN